MVGWLDLHQRRMLLLHAAQLGEPQCSECESSTSSLKHFFIIILHSFLVIFGIFTLVSIQLEISSRILSS
jgi:hypothetical protein